MKKEYTILFGNGRNKENFPFYYYLTRYYTKLEYSNITLSTKEIYKSEGEKKDEKFSYKTIREKTKEEDLFYFSLEEAERILRKLRKIIKKSNGCRARYKYYSKYADGLEPFIVKRTKIRKYLKSKQCAK